MELYNALKKVVELQTEDILKDVKLINILSDFKAYDDMPSSKYLLKYMVSEGLMANLLYEYQSQNDVDLLLSSHIKLISDTYGYKENLAEYVIRCIAFSLGWTNETPSLNNHDSKVLIDNSNNSTPPQIFDDGHTHLTFRQLPITGDINVFIKNLESLGYTIELPFNAQYSAAILKGQFAGVNDCKIIVVATPQTRITCRVVVSLPEQQVWYKLKSDYNEYKDKLTKKYGKPKSYEFFSEPYSEGDGYEMTALSVEKCNYSSYFEDKDGTIVVRLNTDHTVGIVYEDKYNTNIGETERNSIANNDL